MYPVNPGGGGLNRRRGLHTSRKIRRVQRLVRSGASNRQITRATRRAVNAINTSQARGTYGRQQKRSTHRLVKRLNRSNNFYARQSAKRVSSARRNTKPHYGGIGSGVGLGGNAVGQGGSKGHGTKPKKKNPPTHNRPPPKLGSPHHQGPGTPGRPHRKPDRPKLKKRHHPKGKGPGKGPGKGKPKKQDIKLGKPGKRLARKITNITENRYLRANEQNVKKEVADFRKRRKYIVKHTKSPKREKKLVQIARKNMMKDVRERGTGAGKLYRKAGLAVSAELDPQLKALTHRVKQTRKERKRTLQDLKGLYERAGAQNESNTERIDTRGANALEDTRNAYERIKENLGSNYGSATQDVKNELSRLGISGVTDAATSGLSRDEKYALSQANLSQAESSSAQRENTQGFDQLMALIGGELQAQGLGARTTARQKFTDEIMSLRDQRSALGATRLGKISTAVTALQAANRAAKSQAIQDRLASRLANREFGLDVAKFKQDTRTQRFQNKLDLKKFGLDKAKFMADQLDNKPKRKKPRGYSNSRTGAVDYLKDRGLKGGGVDLYIRVEEAANNIASAGGWANLPQRKDNHMIKYLMTHTNLKTAPLKLKLAIKQALQIEWGLI